MGYMSRCFIKSKGEVLFTGSACGIIASLDGYAIIPLEDYRILTANLSAEKARLLADVKYLPVVRVAE